jgi:hypothetical protein
MKLASFRPAALALLAIPALAGSLLLSSCNSQPTATEADKTATVVPSETNTTSDSAAVTPSGTASDTAAAK